MIIQRNRDFNNRRICFVRSWNSKKKKKKNNRQIAQVCHDRCEKYAKNLSKRIPGYPSIDIRVNKMVMLPIPFIPLNLKPEKTILLRPNSERGKKKKKKHSQLILKTNSN